VSFTPLVNANQVADITPPQTTPTITIYSPVNGAHYSEQSIPLAFDVQEPSTWPGLIFDFLNPRPHINWIKYSLDNSEEVNTPSTTTRDKNTYLFTYHCEDTLKGLSVGKHELKISLSYSTPLEQNIGTEYQTKLKSLTVYFSVDDTTSPAVFLTSPSNTTYTENMVKLQFTINESASVGYILDGQEMISVTQNPTLMLSGLSDGTHSIMLYAQDESGNIATTQTVYFTIDTLETFPTLWVLVTIFALLTLIFVIVFISYKRKKG
jgi:hypothetical protein